MKTTRSARARVDDEAMGRISRLFDGGLNEVAQELLQNARRAGATEVRAEVAGGALVVSDNGTGIADPETVLAFGYSGWDEKTAEAEDAAGMGCFALALRRSRITSRAAGGET